MPLDRPLLASTTWHTACRFAPLMALMLIVLILLTACSDIDDAEAGAIEALDDDTGGLQPGEQVPDLTGDVVWLTSVPANLPPDFPADLLESGNVVLIDFWSYSCADCLRSLDAVADWHRRYTPHGLTVVGVHAPAFGFEESPEEVQQAMEEEGVHYPVVQDNDHAVWTAFENEAWPARYVLGADGTVVHRFVGEGGFAATESA
ncbi:MAG: redoxin domain-containing protein, partial [Dehalococcoidia bacterium]